MTAVFATWSARSEALRLRLSTVDRTTLAGSPDFLGRPKHRFTRNLPRASIRPASPLEELDNLPLDESRPD